MFDRLGDKNCCCSVLAMTMARNLHGNKEKAMLGKLLTLKKSSFPLPSVDKEAKYCHTIIKNLNSGHAVSSIIEKGWWLGLSFRVLEIEASLSCM